MSLNIPDAGYHVAAAPTAPAEPAVLPKKSRPSKPALFWMGICLLLVPGLVNAYLLMPFPGSQNIEAITFCYYLEKVLLPLRIAGAIILLFYLIRFFPALSLKSRLIRGGAILMVLASFFFTDFQFKAEKMFAEPKDIVFSRGIVGNKVPLSDIVIGVVHNGVAKAYPLIYLGYHHKIQDDVNGLPVMVTYCTMCRTGRVFNPIFDGKRETFRLVGARHYNAIIEDATTKTWWYQATGVAAVGARKGKQLQELPYSQATLSNWLQRYPNSLVLQPDNHYTAGYDELKNYDRLQAVDKDSTLVNKDALVRKSWVLGVKVGNGAKAYNWRRLVSAHLFNDEISATPLLIGVEADSLSYHVWRRDIDGVTLHFKPTSNQQFTDIETASVWNWDGLCLFGTNKGKKLIPVQAYQEYWHSWKHFNPQTTYAENFK